MNSWEFYSRIEMFKHTQKDAQKDDELAHYGITGQKWGKRRWQYEDGRFNPEGKERYFGTKSKKENSSDTGVKDYIKYKNENSDQKQKFGGRAENDITDDSSKAYDKLKEHIGVDFREPNQKFGSIDSKEAKKLAKEAKKLEKEFTTTSKYDSSYKYFDSDKIEKWLDKEENKAVEKAYADAMETAFGDTSKELHKLFKDYDDNENEYVAKAAICDSLDYYDNLGDISSEIRWFMGDDGDQGSRNSHAYYLNEKGYNAKQINDKLADAEKALNEGYEVGKKLSQYYNPVILHMPDDLQKKVYNNIHYRWEKSDDYSFNKLLNAHEGLDFDKNNMKTADNFTKKLQPSCGNDFSGWMYLNKAINNLNMNDISYKDLTDADWNRINDEVNKLKR